MKQIFISSVQKEFECERAAIKKMIETDPIIKPYFKAFVFEIDAPAADKTTQQIYLDEIANLQQLMPDYPRSYVQSVLRKLRKDGKIRSEGTTSSARWFAVLT